MPRFPVQDRYRNDWEINRNSWLWSPSTKLALLGDGYGTNVARSSGPGSVTGTLTAASMWKRLSTGRNGVAFDGTNYIDTGLLVPSGIPALSVFLWAKAGSLGATKYIIDTSNGSAGVIIRTNDNEWLAYVFMSTVKGPSSLGTLDGNWHHIGIVWTGAVLLGYRDGIQVDSDSTTGSFTGSASPLIYGAEFDGTDAITAESSDLVVAFSALSPPQIRQLASRRPDMDGLIRSKYDSVWPVSAGGEAPTASTIELPTLQLVI